MPEKYLFSWDNVPGNDSIKLMMFLTEDLGICFEKQVKIDKSDDGKVICVSMDKNSVEIRIAEGEENKVTLKISDDKIYDGILKVSEVNDGLDIYYYKNPLDDVKPPDYTRSLFAELKLSTSFVERERAIAALCQTRMASYGYRMGQSQFSTTDGTDILDILLEINAQTYRNYRDPMLWQLQFGTTDDADRTCVCAATYPRHGLSYRYYIYPTWSDLVGSPDLSNIDENQQYLRHLIGKIDINFIISKFKNFIPK